MSLLLPQPDASEADVETQIVIPLLSRPEFLNIALSSIKSKEYLPAFDVGKGQKARKGYIPDYCVYILSLPVMIVEVKSPQIPVHEAWEEASLYSHVMNKRFPAKTNPCQYTFATNGHEFRAGRWDNERAEIEGHIVNLVPGGGLLRRLQALIGNSELERWSQVSSASLKLLNFKRSFDQREGQTLIVSKLEPNTFAADVAPVLRRYFSSRDQNNDPEILKNAYVSSEEITSYDKFLESFLVDRLSRSKNRTEI